MLQFERGRLDRAAGTGNYAGSPRGEPALAKDRGVGAPGGALENVGEFGTQVSRCRLVHVDFNALAHGDHERAQIIDPMRMVRVRMRHEDAVETSHAGVDQLQAQVRRSVDQHQGPAVGARFFQQGRAAATAVAGICGIAGPPSLRDARHAARRAAAQQGERDAHALPSRSIFANSRSVLARVAAAIAEPWTPLASASARAVSTTKAGSLRRPRWGTGARNGASVSTSTRSSGTSRAIARNSAEFLNVSTPEKETWSPSSRPVSASARDEVKQCSTASKAPTAISSRRIAATSSSASRAWITSGSPNSRAMAICPRNTRAATSRGA